MLSAPFASLVSLFVAKDKRERILFLASKPSRRRDLCDALLHDTRSLDRSALVPLPRGEGDVAAVTRRLRASAKAQAYCISALDELDDRELALAEALRLAIGRSQDTIVFCLETRLAYYENHEGEQYVLERR